MLCRLCAPGGTIGVVRTGIFLSSMTASPPSTFFSCAFRAAVAAARAVVVRKLRRAVSIRSVRSGFSVAGLFVFFDGIAGEARRAYKYLCSPCTPRNGCNLSGVPCHRCTPPCICGSRDRTGCTCSVDRDAEQRKAGEETQYRSYRTNSIAVSSSVPPCQHEQHNECRDSDQKRRQALYPHLRFIKGIAVRPLGEIGKQVVFPSVQGSEKIGSDTPVGGCTERAKPRTSRCRRSGLR